MIHPAQWAKFINEVNAGFAQDRERIAKLEQEIVDLKQKLEPKPEVEAPRRGRPPKDIEMGA